MGAVPLRLSFPSEAVCSRECERRTHFHWSCLFQTYLLSLCPLELLISAASLEETISSVVSPQSHQFISFKDVSLRDSAHAVFTG